MKRSIVKEFATGGKHFQFVTFGKDFFVVAPPHEKPDGFKLVPA